MTTDPSSYEFAACPDRQGTGSEKWDRWPEQDVLPMWVADMDFCTPPEVLNAIHQRTQHGVFGYTHEPPGFADALANHLQHHHAWNIDPSSVIATPGVVTGLAITARLLSQPDDEIKKNRCANQPRNAAYLFTRWWRLYRWCFLGGEVDSCGWR